jgi:hypothetical protein
MDAETKKLVTQGAASLILITVITLVIRSVVIKAKKNKARKIEERLALELGTQKTPQQSTEESQAAAYNPSSDYKKIFNWIDGANWQQRGTEVNSITNRLTDAKLIKLAKYWEKKQSGESLYYWLDWEAGDFYGVSMARLKSLGYT